MPKQQVETCILLVSLLSSLLNNIRRPELAPGAINERGMHTWGEKEKMNEDIRIKLDTMMAIALIRSICVKQLWRSGTDNGGRAA